MSDPFDDLDALTVQIVGEPIGYNIAPGAAPNIKAFVNHAPGVQDFGAAVAAVSDRPEIQVLKTDVPVPSKDDRIFLPRTGLTYRPMNWDHSRCGRLWDIALTKVI